LPAAAEESLPWKIDKNVIEVVENLMISRFKPRKERDWRPPDGQE
jgi:hypothetical protein